MDNFSKVARRPLTYGRQCIDDEDKRAVLQVLEGDWLTQGPLVARFETELSSRFETKHAVACSSGTAALHLAAMSLGWQQNEIVIVPAITFLATANSCVYVGAEPYFVDIDERTLTIDPNEVEKHVRLLRNAGRRVRAIIGVDMAGHACDWPALRSIADRYGLNLVDDACHAMGGSYAGGTKVGSCSHVDVAILSFHPVKHITTAEGGAVLTNDPAIADASGRLRNHGTVRGQDLVSDWEGPWQYDMIDLGYNYRLTDLQCALGISQLRKLDRFVASRRRIANLYDERLKPSPLLKIPVQREDVVHSFHLYVVRAPFDELKVSRRQLFERCREAGLLLQVHYRPVLLNSFYRNRGLNENAERRLPASMAYYRQALSLPMFPQLTEEDVDWVVDTLQEHLATS